MAQEPLATKGNYLHIYDFRVRRAKRTSSFACSKTFDYSDGNPMHKSSAQVKDGVLCRDTEDPQRFFLIAEWSDIEEHARIRKILANDIKPEFIKYIEGRQVRAEICRGGVLDAGRDSEKSGGGMTGKRCSPSKRRAAGWHGFR